MAESIYILKINHVCLWSSILLVLISTATKWKSYNWSLFSCATSKQDQTYATHVQHNQQWIKSHAIAVPTIVVPSKVYSSFGWTSYSWISNSKSPAIVGRL